MDIDGSFGKLHLSTRLLGRFNAENALVVLGCLVSLGGSGCKRPRLRSADATAPPGRMEVIESTAQGKPKAVIDYAHHTRCAGEKRCARFASIVGELSGACSAAEATATRQAADDGRGRDELADQIIVTTTIRVPRIPPRSSAGSSAESRPIAAHRARPGRRDRGGLECRQPGRRSC